MFGSRRREMAELRGAIAALTAAVEGQKTAAADSLTRAIEKFAEKSIERQADNLEAMARVTSQMSDLMVRKTAQLLGSRGARKANETKRIRKEMRGCEVCARGYGTSDQIVKHVMENHERQLEWKRVSEGNGRATDQSTS